jgi:integrase
LIGLGQFPDVSLADARDRRDQARKLVGRDVDPSAERRAIRAAQANTLSAVATECLSKLGGLAPETLQRIRDRLDTWILPLLGRLPIAAIRPADLLPVLRRIEAAGRHETAHRARADVSRVFRYAIAAGLAERDITVDLRGALTPVKVAHFAAVTDPVKVGQLLRAIDGYRGQPITELALRIAPYVFVRPGELRHAEWSEIDLRERVWRIPAEKTKMRRIHVVPLAHQVVRLFRELETHTGDGRLVFPTLRDPDRPMSENTLNAALRRMGYARDEMTSHGFRTIASTLLNELGVAPDLIEKQLAHQDQNAVRDAYNRAERLAERTKLMQRWADHLDKLRKAKRNG